MLRTVDLFKHFGGFVAIDGVDFELEEGEKHAIIGPNGAGKTTFFHLITGHLQPDRGRVEYEGRELTGLPPHRIVKAGLARSFQRVNVYPRMSVFENVQVALMARDDRHFTMFRIGARFNREETSDLLSPRRARGGGGRAGGGARLRQARSSIELAIALAERPRVLLLDEPTAGMSPSETEEAIRLIQEIADARNLTLLFHRARHDGGVRHRGPHHRAPQRRRHRFRCAPRRCAATPRCGACISGRGAMAQLELRDVHTAYGRSQVLFGVSFSVEPRRVRRPYRAQRCRQDHHHPQHSGADRSAPRRDRMARREHRGPAVASGREARDRLRARGAADLPRADGLGEPRHRPPGDAGGMGRGTGVRALSGS